MPLPLITDVYGRGGRFVVVVPRSEYDPEYAGEMIAHIPRDQSAPVHEGTAALAFEGDPDDPSTQSVVFGDGALAAEYIDLLRAKKEKT